MSLDSFPTIQSFVKEGGGDPSVVDDLVKEYCQYPSPFAPTVKSPYSFQLHKQYSSQDTCKNSIANLVMQHILSPLTNPYDPAYKHTNQSFGFSVQDIESLMQTFLFRHALQFVVSKLGGCARRACYAGVVLAKTLPESARVFVTSNTKKDHFVIQIQLKPKEWYVYDPFTNPERVFPSDVYKRDILSLFPDVPIQAEACTLQVTKKLSNEFYSKLPMLIQKIHAQFFSTVPAKEKLLASPVFCIALQSLTSSDPKLAKEQLPRSIALIQEIAKNAAIPPPAPTATSAAAMVGSSSDLQQGLAKLQISSTGE